jgi:SAM-dependent methyltransferase
LPRLDNDNSFWKNRPVDRLCRHTALDLNQCQAQRIAGVLNAMPLGFYPATAMPAPDWWDALWPRPGEVIAALGVRPGAEAVDLCCGDGLFTVPLARTARRVIAIDLDPEMLNKAREKLAAVGVTNCEFVEGDAYAVVEMVRDPVDFVLMANTFHGVPEKERLAHAVASVLKPQGRFAVINWHRRPREQTIVLGQPRGPNTEMRMEPAEVATAVEPAGLKLVHVIELPPYHYGAIFKKPGVEPPGNDGERHANERDEQSKQSKGSAAEDGPMAMGREMAKKMMAQMSQGDRTPPMEKMMGMCMGGVIPK